MTPEPSQLVDKCLLHVVLLQPAGHVPCLPCGTRARFSTRHMYEKPFSASHQHPLVRNQRLLPDANHQGRYVCLLRPYMRQSACNTMTDWLQQVTCFPEHMAQLWDKSLLALLDIDNRCGVLAQLVKSELGPIAQNLYHCFASVDIDLEARQLLSSSLQVSKCEQPLAALARILGRLLSLGEG